MPASRPSSPRGSGSGPRGSARRTTSGRPGARPGTGPGRRPAAQRARTSAQRQPAPRPRFTGRAAILVVVLAVLMVSYASSMRAYLQQNQHIDALNANIAESEAAIKALTREKKRWDDPAYVRAQAHQRFGWVLPGEIGFQVIGEDGQPLDHEDSLSDAGALTETARPIWWKSAWRSMEAAGNPKDVTVPEPATRIRAPKTPAKKQ